MEHTNFILVEDSESDAHMIKRIIQQQEIVDDYLWLKDGEEAVGYFDTYEYKPEKPCLVLLDINLPKCSGFEVLKHIRENEKTRHIPIVIYSSSREKKDVKMAYEVGANSYISKPVNFKDLKMTLQHLTTYWLKLNKAY
jgi:DNA-binding response OmpR family regulator